MEDTKFRKRDKTLIIIGCISVLLILLGDLEFISFENENYYKYCRSAGFFLQVILWSLYYYKYNYKKASLNE